MRRITRQHLKMQQRMSTPTEPYFSPLFCKFNLKAIFMPKPDDPSCILSARVYTKYNFIMSYSS